VKFETARAHQPQGTCKRAAKGPSFEGDHFLKAGCFKLYSVVSNSISLGGKTF
jgi:hypothetical protein